MGITACPPMKIAGVLQDRNSRVAARIPERMAPLHFFGKDIETARKRRDEMLAAFDSGKPVPYLTIK